MAGQGKIECLSIGKRGWVSILLILLGGGLLCAGWLAQRADREMRRDLLRLTNRVAESINIEYVKALTGTPADMESPEYIRLKRHLCTVRVANPTCRFAYLMGRKEDHTIFFLLDVQDDEREETPACAPGELYDDASTALIQSFDSGQPFLEGPLTDEWGTWISAIVPLTDPAEGTVLAVLGLDIDVRDWRRQVWAQSGPPVGLLLLAVFAILAIGVTVRSRCAQLKMPPRWMRHCETGLVVALGLALTGFAAWWAQTASRRNQADAFRYLAESRTAELGADLHNLRDIQLEGLATFIETHQPGTASLFRQYTTHLIRNQAVQAWGWVPMVPASEVEQVQQVARASGLDGFEIWEQGVNGARRVAADRAVYYPVLWGAPQDAHRRIIGFDLGSEPVRAATIKEALRTGYATASMPIPLAQETEEQKGILVFRPVWNADPEPAIFGLVLAVLRLNEVLDVADADYAVGKELLHGRADVGLKSLARSWKDKTPDTPLTLRRPLSVFGHTFFVEAHAGPAFLRAHPAQGGGIAMLIGLLLTIAMAIVTSVVLRHRALISQELGWTRRQVEQFFNQSLHGFYIAMCDKPIEWNDQADKQALLEYVLDHERMTRINQAMLDQYGAQKADFIGVPVRNLFEHDPERLRKVAWNLLEQGHTHEETHEFKKDGTPIIIDGEYICLYDDQGRVIGHFGVQMDVTARKQAEDDLRDINRTLEASIDRANVLVLEAEAANVAKSQFLANMSHEIRTPMNGVIGMTGLLLDTDLDETQRRYAESVNYSAEALLALLNDILDFSKIESGKLEVEQLAFDLKDTLDTVTAMMDVKAREKGLVFCCEWAPDVPAGVVGDPARLRQVLLNLAGNAIKFTETGTGTVRVEKRAADATLRGPQKDREQTHPDYADDFQEPPDIPLHAPLSPDEVLLHFTVTDTGIGISAEKQRALFQQFSQLDASTTRKYGGTGLGLAISKQLVELMGGEIGVRSEEGKGAEFWFTLPFTRTAGQPAVQPQHEPANVAETFVAAPSSRLLLAEDDLTNQAVALGVLKKFGFTNVDVVGSGRAALAAVQANPYDLVLMDVQMPDMDGMEATAQIRETLASGGAGPMDGAQKTSANKPNLPIIAMTAHAMQGDREKCLAAGMDDYVSKPIVPKALAAVLKKWLPQAAYEPATADATPAPEEQKPLPAAPPIWDRAGLSQRLMGDEQLIEAILTGFLKDIPHQIEALRGYLAEGGAADAERQAHTIKGAAANVGAKALCARAAELEQLGRANQLPALQEQVAALEQAFDAFLKETKAQGFSPAE